VAKATDAIRERAAVDADPIGVVTVDDQAVFRAAAHEIIDATPGFCALSDASSGPDGRALVDELEPDIVLVDVRMPGMDGVATARELTARHPGSVVVLISIADAANVPSTASRCGAVALVRKQDFSRTMLVDLWATYGAPEDP